MAAVSQHRLHVGGLAATVTEKDLMNRFSSFGTVVEGSVTGLGLDANGAPKKFAFLTLETTEAGVKKCTSLLSGSVWKGVKLRIAPAKPDYQARLATELSTPTSTQPTKKRKQSSDPSVGRPAPFFELVDSTNFARHRGWALDTSATTLSSSSTSTSTSTPVTPAPIFPLITRPSHPLPPVPRAASTSWTREAPKAKASKEARAAAKAGLSVLPNTISRAQRVRIDVRRWGRKKIVYGDEEWGGSEGFGRLRGVWEVEDEEVDDDEAMAAAAERSEKDKEMVKWVFRTRDGKVRRSEVVKLGRRSIAHTDRFTALLEGLNRPAPSLVPSPSSLEHAPDTFEIDVPVIPSSLSDRPTKRQKSLSPPPYIPAAPRTLLFNEEDTFALITSTQEEDEVEQARREERKKQLDVLKFFLADDGENVEVEEEVEKDQEAGHGKKGPQVEGYGNEESDDDEEFMGILNQGRTGVAMSLRGGAAPMEGESDEDDSDSDSEDDEDEEEVPESSTSKKEKEKGVSKDQLNSLKDMFKPQETTSSFSLLSGMALDIDPLDLERSPSPPLESFPMATLPKMIPIPQQQPSHSQTRQPQNLNFVPPPALGRSKRAWVGTGGVTAFYPVVEGGDLDDKTVEERKKEWLGNQKIAEGFHRTQSLEEIEADHQKLRDTLRGLARKRHREASKKGRGKGVKRAF